MADYGAVTRSNYFRVKDKQKFIEWCDSLELKPITKENDEKLCGFLVRTDNGAMPTHKGDEDFDFFQELATHLVDGEVAVVIEVGAEKDRYLCGFADAVNSQGEMVSVCLDDIYAKAEKLGSNITEVAY